MIIEIGINLQWTLSTLFICGAISVAFKAICGGYSK
jgi:hypothetical protein